ncbi:hypothetical protein JJB07_14850 [Tumebacillus sp. ITR2]|uniref:Uncharacterized protein n=1 Tax=Tumebacillus amylolyticus TaxID=2801339 RepID=A0ABS1JCB7_9BACL|nr:hypothetical protein [Tumebacillus amylolyticus]MBL0387917.1 hypothetical protein [Tumebacillus amylolyticus]
MEFNPFVPGFQGEVVFEDRKICAVNEHPHHRLGFTLAPYTGGLYSGTILGCSSVDELLRPVTRASVVSGVAGEKSVTLAPGESGKFGWLMYPANKDLRLYSSKPDGSSVQDLGPITGIAGDLVSFTTALTEDVETGDLLYLGDGCETAVVVLADTVPDSDKWKGCTAYVKGVFIGSCLIGLDSVARRDLNARVIPAGKTISGQPEQLVVI